MMPQNDEPMVKRTKEKKSETRDKKLNTKGEGSWERGCFGRESNQLSKSLADRAGFLWTSPDNVFRLFALRGHTQSSKTLFFKDTAVTMGFSFGHHLLCKRSLIGVARSSQSKSALEDRLKCCPNNLDAVFRKMLAKVQREFSLLLTTKQSLLQINDPVKPQCERSR